MKRILSLFFILSISGCKKDNSFCGLKDPVNEIEWLNEYTTESTIVHCEIFEATYMDIDGFYIKMYFDSIYSNSGSVFKNCKGESICGWGGITPPNCPDYSQHESHRELIYSR